MTTEPVRIGIFGAGKSGSAIARRALAVGYPVTIATSGPADRVELITSIVTPGAATADASELASRADIVVLATPLRRFRELPLDTLGGLIVIDLMNYWPPVDGALDEFEDSPEPSSLTVARALPPTARLVKTLNHIGYHQMEDLAAPPRRRDRIAVGISADDANSARAVATFVDRLGFEPVMTGDLAHSHLLEPGSAAFGSHVDQEAFRGLLLTELTRTPIATPALT
jgi:predicted dinucleotide-binding enzyme